MGFLEEFGFKIFRIREAKQDSEFLVYDISRKAYNCYSEKRVVSILNQELISHGHDIVKFAVEHLDLPVRNARPLKLINNWKDAEVNLIDNLGYMPFDDITFEENNKILFNTYKKSKLLKSNETYAHDEFINIKILINNLVGGNEEEYTYFIKWLAWQVQNPLRRLPTSIILQGEHGTGKTKFCELVLKPLFENNFCEIGQSDINKEYNDYIMGKQLIVANEVIHNDNKFLVPDKLKNYVTDEYLSINRKFKDTIYVRNYSQWIFVTNNQVPLKIETGDRRYSVFKSKKLSNGRKLISDILDNYQTELNSFIYYLKTIKVNYKDVDSPIENEAKKELIKASYNSVQEFYDYIFNELGGIDKFNLAGLNIRLHSHNDRTFIITNEFYLAYKAYCLDVGYKHSSKTHFTRTLNQFGFKTSVEWMEKNSVRVLIKQ